MILNLIGFLSGFLLSSIFDTTLGEFQEWAIVVASLIVSGFEIINKIFYQIYFKVRSKKNYTIIKLVSILNFLKVVGKRYKATQSKVYIRGFILWGRMCSSFAKKIFSCR